VGNHFHAEGSGGRKGLSKSIRLNTESLSRSGKEREHVLAWKKNEVMGGGDQREPGAWMEKEAQKIANLR